MSSRESQQQGASGRRGAESERMEGEGGQPRQGSDRVEQPRGNEEEKHHFEEGRRPSEQGEQDHPSPGAISSGQQGFGGAGRASGSHARGDRSEERASSGEPSGDHTRHGREQTPGDRSNR